LIEAENLTKYYGSFLAIRDVSFKVNQGEIIGFLGPNGAGKTTTMRILTGFMPPSSGTVRVAGYDLQKESIEVRKRIGYLPESVPLYRDMTVRAYLRFLASIRGVRGRRRETRVGEVIDICRLENYARTPIAKLSKGYRQLVGVAQAIVHEPEVLILDEPTIGIDPRQVVHIRQLIKELGRERTVILSSHILPEVSMICERVMIMDKGRIVSVDLSDNLSARLEGSQRFEIEAEGEPEKLIPGLEAVEGVIGVQVEGSGPARRYLVECRPDLDIRNELASAVVASGLSLLGLKTQEMSLEEIFLKLTTVEEE